MKELIPLGIHLVGNIARDEEKIKYFLSKNWFQIEVLRSVYQTLVNTKELTPIEDLEDSEKQRLWGIIKKWVVGDREHKLKCVRALYFIEQTQQQKVST